MKKLSVIEVNKSMRVGQGRVSVLLSSELFEETDKIMIGEAVCIENNEWPLENMPTSAQLNNAHKSAKTGKKFMLRRIPVKKGYAFIRIE